jgi:hypothetical protein
MWYDILLKPELWYGAAFIGLMVLCIIFIFYAFLDLDKYEVVSDADAQGLLNQQFIYQPKHLINGSDTEYYQYIIKGEYNADQHDQIDKKYNYLVITSIDSAKKTISFDQHIYNKTTDVVDVVETVLNGAVILKDQEGDEFSYIISLEDDKNYPDLLDQKYSDIHTNYLIGVILSGGSWVILIVGGLWYSASKAK